MGFKKGEGGRPRGARNKATGEAQRAAASIVDDPTYRKNLKARALAGELAPAVEAMLWHYAKGKPPDELRVGDSEGNPLGPITFILRGRSVA